MYPEYLVEPMRAELTNVGFDELKTPEEVDAAIKSESPIALHSNRHAGDADVFLLLDKLYWSR